MTFLDLPIVAQGFFELWVALVQFLYLYNFFCITKIGRAKTNVRCILLLTGNFALFQILCQHSDGDLAICPVVLPLWALVLLILTLTTLSITEQVRIIQWRQSHVTDSSAKEAMDALPTGLCYALPAGLPLLVNEKMEELGKVLLDDPFSDAEVAWKRLSGGEANGRLVQSGEEPIYALENGKTYSFRRNEIRLKEGMVNLILATDVSQEYSMTMELREKQRRVKVVNARLKSLKETIEYVTMSRELLQMKVAMHDNLGRALLMAKRHVVNPQSVDVETILTEWKDNLSHLIGEEPEPWQIPYYVIGKEAASLGIDLQIVGELPKEERLLPVIDQAISSHVINVLRHADGHTAYVGIREEAKEWRISFTNDGNPPAGPINETGGLGSLRRNVEELGGELQIKSSPRFEMILWLPRGGATAGNDEDVK